MEKIFKEFYIEKNDQRIWQDSIIVLDTNVLLNLYRYSKDTTVQILNLLNKYQDQLWMPHQVALEYHFNRKKVILEQEEYHTKISESFSKVPKEIEKILLKDLSDFKKRHRKDIDNFISDLEKLRDNHIESLEKQLKNEISYLKKDFIKENITNLFSEKVGISFNAKEIESLEKTAEERFSKKIPPGYDDDKAKDGSFKYYNKYIIQNRYGDYILWRQIIEYATVEKRDIIFITDEQKSDWWYKLGGKVIGPRIELINEFSYETKKKLYMFSPIGFINRNEDIVNESAANEVEELADNIKNISNEIENRAKLINYYMDTGMPTGDFTENRSRVKKLGIRFESFAEINRVRLNNSIEKYFLSNKRVRGLPKITWDFYNITREDDSSIYTSQFFLTIQTDAEIEDIFYSLEDALVNNSSVIKVALLN
ncbi:PIN domain-containing protein [Bacillus sp. FSL W7-1034]|uniref:PIN-like domain-containing protein n=1 Tax=Bacillus sp. FSL W7-1034 TaxID=2954564 RepID=UPI00315AB91A